MDRIWEWIKVEMDLWEGLMEEIELESWGCLWVQKLDYWKIPFLYFGCHEVGHLLDSCIRMPKRRMGWRKEWVKKASKAKSIMVNERDEKETEDIGICKVQQSRTLCAII